MITEYPVVNRFTELWHPIYCGDDYNMDSPKIEQWLLVKYYFYYYQQDIN